MLLPLDTCLAKMSDVLYGFHQPHFVAGVDLECADVRAGKVDRTLSCSEIPDLREFGKPGAKTRS